MSARANDFLVWRAAQSVNWDCTHKDIADEVGLSPRAVSAIMARRGWKCQPQDVEFSQPGYVAAASAQRYRSLRELGVDA